MNVKRQCILTLMLLSIIIPTVYSQSADNKDDTLIFVPKGDTPTIDGVISPSEWDKAYSIAFETNHRLLFMHDNKYLYIGLSSNSRVIGSIAIYRGGKIIVMHSSGAPGQAEYEKIKNIWQLKKEFSWSCKSSNGQSILKSDQVNHLEQEGWLASHALAGVPGQMEYQISIQKDPIPIVITYERINTHIKIKFPTNISDGSQNNDLLGGDAPESLEFLPGQWATINIVSISDK